MLFYSPGDGNWWLGTFNANQVIWNLAGNTGKPGTGFGNLVTAGCLFWVGDFSNSGSDQMLFYHPSDGNWWLGTFNAGQLSWNLAGNTGVSVNFSADVPYAIVAFSAPLVGGATDIVNGIAYCLSHEMVEALSNPRGNGFYADANGCEIADICEANPSTGQVVTVQVGIWSVEQYWSNDDNACVS